MSEIELAVLRDTATRRHLVEEHLSYLKSESTSAVNGPKKDGAAVSRVSVPASNGQEYRPTKKQKRKEHIQFVALCWTLFLAGWNDGSLGPLLPRIQSVYHVGFAIVSLLFVLACIGFISGAVLNVVISDKFGFGKVLLLGSLLQVLAYTLQAPALPFPVFVISYTINGIGLAVQDAQANGYVACMKDNAETKMGFLHAAYGAGASASPLVATRFAQLRHWSFHYLVSLGIGITNSIILYAVFRMKKQEECLIQIGLAQTEQNTTEDSKFAQIMKHRTVNLLAFFILVYVGVEVTIGGWIVTFIINERKGGANSGYISAGFFGGLTVGRVALLWLNKLVGEWRVLFLYALIAIGLEVIVWLVPSLIGDAVAVSLIGVLLGPMYPIAMNHAGRVLPSWILTASIGWIAGFGQAGSAVFPFMTGALSSKFGIQSLQPLLVAMMGLMIVMWAAVPGGLRVPE